MILCATVGDAATSYPFGRIGFMELAIQRSSGFIDKFIGDEHR